MKTSFTKIDGFVLLGCMFLLCLLYSDWRQSKVDYSNARVTYRSDICRRKLEVILYALKSYHRDHGAFPPPILETEDGMPYSWRAAILPYLEIRDYKTDEPWNGPHNSTLHEKVSPLFRCPHEDSKTHSSSYFMVVNQETGLAPADTQVLLVEAYNTGIHCLEPRDIPLENLALGARQPGDNRQELLVGGKHIMQDEKKGFYFVVLKTGEMRLLSPSFPIDSLFHKTGEPQDSKKN